MLWRRLFDYKFYDYADNLSAAWIWSRIRRIGRSRYNLFHEKLGLSRRRFGHAARRQCARYIEAHGGEFRLSDTGTESRDRKRQA